MKIKVLYVERKAHDFVSIEKAFRQVASSISERFETAFQQLPYGFSIVDTMKNLLFFRKENADIYHITGHVHYISLLFSPRNTVLSVMDLRFLEAEPGLRRFILKKLYLDLPVKRLRYITAISEQTRQEILINTRCSEAKVRTLDLPLLEHIIPGQSIPFNELKPRILQVGTMQNKNVPVLAKALNGITCKLVVIGNMDGELTAALKENFIDFENHFGLSDADLRNEYEKADIVSFCSTYEGFGLPIIEAQSMRKPVITSDLSPLKETSGGAAVLVNPNSSKAIRDGIVKLISDSRFRESIVEAGVRNIERFRPEIVAIGYEALYSEILSEK